MRFCTKVICAVIALIVFGISQANAQEIVYHIGAKHSGSFDYNNATRGLGIKWDSSAVGAYMHSYANLPDNGALSGYAIYASKDVASVKRGNVKVSAQINATYGYPDWLDANVKGLMLIPSVTVEIGNKHYGLAISTVPGSIVGNDNAHMLSFIVK